jgi:hypothetical protein
MFYVVQAVTALILYTGGNTSFNGFPFLTSFVAEDSFLPRWMMKRGQRLVFSNGIIVLTILSVTLIAVVGANVNALVPFYAIGVFTVFSMAGFGMARYHTRRKEPGWRHKRVINFSAGVMTAIVVLIFAVGEVHRGRLADPDHHPPAGHPADQAQPGIPARGAGAAEHRRAPRLGRGPAAAELHPAGRHRVRRRSTSRARPPSRAGSGWSRSGRWSGTRCWPARSATSPGT